MVDVFISYSRRDAAKVGQLARAIAEAGYDVWWDEELPPHKSYGDVITDKIAMASAALVVWSKDSVQSEWVRAEADMARNQRKLIQSSLDDVMPPLPFNQIQYAAIGDWQGEAEHSGWRKIKASLNDLCGPRRPADAPARPVLPSAPPPVAPVLSQPDAQPQAQFEHQPHPQPPPAASNAPLFAGIAIAAAALIGVGAFWLGQRDSAPQETAVASSQAGPATSDDTDADKAVATSSSSAPAANPVAAPAAPPAPASAPVEAEVARASSTPDMTFPDSSTRLLAPSDVAPLGPATLRIARNEIYARKGRRFKDPWLRDYFSQFAWYQPLHDDVALNAIERRNVALLTRAEARYR